MAFKHEQYAKLLIRQNPKWPASTKEVLRCVADHTNNDDLSWPSYNTIATETGIGISTVTRAIAALERDNIISKLAGVGVNQKYHFPAPIDFNEKGNEHMHPRGTKQLSREEKSEAARELYHKMTGEPWYAPCESEEEYYELDAMFKEHMAAGKNPFDLIRQLASIGESETLSSIAKPLPYNKSVRTDGCETPTNRGKYDNE